VGTHEARSADPLAADPLAAEPADLDAFWATTLEDARKRRSPTRFVPVASPLRLMQVADVTFSGYAGQPIRGWFLAPRGSSVPLPVIVEYVGYGGGRSLPIERTLWPSAGYAYLVMDNRGQDGDTPDVETEPPAGQQPGFLTRGIHDPAAFYYRRLITDAVLAVDAVREHPYVDPTRVVVAGESQGGGLALAVAGLDRSVAAALIDVPFLCHIRRAVELASEGAYLELVAHLAYRRDRADEAFRTLAYVEGCSFARRATAPALFSAGRLDRHCPAETVIAAHDAYGGPADIAIWPFNGHDAALLQHQVRRFEFLERLGIAPG
jgi:cephalosporin-C deacetylase